MEQKIGQLFDSALQKAKEERAKLNRKIWVPEYARLKLQFKFRNGTSSIPYHSYDIHRGAGGVNITNEATGYAKLLALVETKRANDIYVVATIWANLTDDLRTYINGKPNMSYDYIVFKHVRGQKPWSSPNLRFANGKLDVELLKGDLVEQYIHRQQVKNKNH